MKKDLSYAALVWLASITFAVAAGSSEHDSVVFEGIDRQPIVTFSRNHGMLRGRVDQPLLRVYADGLVRVQVPGYMKDAGHYEYRLSPAALTALVSELDTAGLLDFDQSSARAEHGAAVAAYRATTGERFITVDSTTTRIELRFGRLTRGDGQGAPLSKTIEWPDVGIDAQRFPQLNAVAGLATAEKTLLALTTHPQRRPVKAAVGE